MSKSIKLVLSGSGVRFPVFIGAIKRLEEEGYIIEAVAGTSGGSLVAAGLACGYGSSTKLLQLTKELAPSITKELKPSIFTFLKSLGILNTSALYKALKNKLKGKMKSTNIPLKVVSTNLDAGNIKDIVKVWDSSKDPEEEVWRLVASSMAIPGLFPPVLINNKEYVDGGWVKNFPVDAWKDSSNVIGLVASSDELTPRPKLSSWRVPSRIVSYVSRLANLSISANMAEDEKEVESIPVVRIETSIDGLDFSLNQDKIDVMFFDGYNAMDTFIRKNKSRLP